MVVTQDALATRVGVEILQKGGNAVDAAVAVGFAMAVTYPRAGNLGGGGFMLIHQADGHDTAIDYRETAPQAITNKTFLDAAGNADPQKSRDSALAIGVPGTVEGLALAERRYGSGHFTLADLIAPAIALARDGFAVTADIVGFVGHRARAAQALAVVGKNLSQTRRYGARALATAWCKAIWPILSSPSPRTDRTRSMSVRSRKKLPPPCRPRVAS